MSEYEQPFHDEDYERQAEEWDEFLRSQEERRRERLRGYMDSDGLVPAFWLRPIPPLEVFRQIEAELDKRRQP